LDVWEKFKLKKKKQKLKLLLKETFFCHEYFRAIRSAIMKTIKREFVKKLSGFLPGKNPGGAH
jgi:hypothetical protein